MIAPWKRFFQTLGYVKHNTNRQCNSRQYAGLFSGGLPAILLGIGAGIYAKRGLTGGTLHGLLEKLLLVMGVVLLIKGINDVI